MKPSRLSSHLCSHLNGCQISATNYVRTQLLGHGCACDTHHPTMNHLVDIVVVVCLPAGYSDPRVSRPSRAVTCCGIRRTNKSLFWLWNKVCDAFSELASFRARHELIINEAKYAHTYKCYGTDFLNTRLCRGRLDTTVALLLFLLSIGNSFLRYRQFAGLCSSGTERLYTFFLPAIQFY